MKVVSEGQVRSLPLPPFPLPPSTTNTSSSPIPTLHSSPHHHNSSSLHPHTPSHTKNICVCTAHYHLIIFLSPLTLLPSYPTFFLCLLVCTPFTLILLTVIASFSQLWYVSLTSCLPSPPPLSPSPPPSSVFPSPSSSPPSSALLNSAACPP